MSASEILARTRRELPAYLELHPEWWVVLTSVAAWGAMLPHAFARGASCHQESFGGQWWNWCLMIVAMMVPLMLGSVRWTAARSFRSRQVRAMAGYLVGYLAPWVGLGFGVAWLLETSLAREPWAAPASFAIAGVWALTPWRESLMLSGHRTITLAPLGVRADADCIRFGLIQGVPCAAGCLPLMLGCALTGHGFVAMAGGALIGAEERLRFRPRPAVAALGCGLLAAWYGVGFSFGAA